MVNCIQVSDAGEMVDVFKFVPLSEFRSVPC